VSVVAIGLGMVASLLGIYYAALGFSAVKYLRSADQIDKAVGWTLWWAFDTKRYAEEGRKLCKRGQVAALTSIALWISVYAVRW
jgi:hypothetical protein